MSQLNDKESSRERNFQLRLREVNIPEKSLLEDLGLIAKEFGQGKCSFRLYKKHGKYSSGTLMRRFGSWNYALIKAGLPILNVIDTPDVKLFENLERVWVSIRKQPGRRDMVKPHSDFSERPYVNRFGSWNNALKEFLNYVNDKGTFENQHPCQLSRGITRRTKRDPDLRLRWRVLQRDHFKCRACGRGWPDVELHVDHVIAWSKGGETVLENLQALSAEHNLGKGNL